jgi:hypothetical protein
MKIRVWRVVSGEWRVNAGKIRKRKLVTHHSLTAPDKVLRTAPLNLHARFFARSLTNRSALNKDAICLFAGSPLNEQ